jgi:hypothetical protein
MNEWMNELMNELMNEVPPILAGQSPGVQGMVD